jgi:hypothetical protein
MRHWPAVSGNAINGVGEEAPRRPSPIYWHPPDSIPHGALQRWFYTRTGDDETLAAARRDGSERSTSRSFLSRRKYAKPTPAP